MSLITILGASGFVGSHLVATLRARNAEHIALRRQDPLPRKHLGDVIYCIGVTADFRSKPFETVEAHVCKLLEVLQHCEFKSLTYLSSTRVYANNTEPAREEDPLVVAPSNASDLYNISKAMGESLSLNSGRNARVVRLANIYGDDFGSENFLATIMGEAIATGKLTLRTSADSEKDYVSIGNVVNGLIEIATSGRQRIYNLASGINVANGALAAKISEAIGCEVEFMAHAPRVTFPPVIIERMRAEFGFQPGCLFDDLHGLLGSYKKSIGNTNDQN